ncbi:hypothetical protein J1N35_019913 [Gossypium stocksii]|uniref:Uncharacterized protein n=1 Tax=Gossypium stocksii TaxID=47602 RepID=A0A9D4A0D1_9ROSI|nr:hypothetical protein J1N35_019913 [Gossypium stocksii]
MASPFSNVFFFSFLVIHFYTVICAEYEGNGDNGWIVPKHDNRTYNNYASTNRFIVNDTILGQPGIARKGRKWSSRCWGYRRKIQHNKQAAENAINNGAVYEFRWLAAVISSILMLFFISAFG